jgi:hypothetical protein
MSNNAYQNFLNGNADLGLKDYQHASRLYVDSNYARAPKAGFIYFLQMNINPSSVLDSTWKQTGGKDQVGLLAKRADLPKFAITNETVNQYNRKTLVQTKLTYNPVTIELHDDNSEITNSLWTHYFKHYYIDSEYTDAEFSDTKYSTNSYIYGRYSRGANQPFFKSIDIFVLYGGKFTQYTLVNPKISEWQHDSVDQGENTKILRNRMTIGYETVLYNQGIIKNDPNVNSKLTVYYDSKPGSLSVGNSKQSLSLSDVAGDTRGTYTAENPLRSNVSLNNFSFDSTNASKSQPAGYSILGGTLGNLSNIDAGIDYSSQFGTFNSPGDAGINIFKGYNSSVDDTIVAELSSLIYRT